MPEKGRGQRRQGKAYQAIKDHFLIGDLHSAALVSKDASIDWLCLPHFDSESIFAAILDKERGGSFSLLTEAAITSEYAKNTAIVEHRCETEDGCFSLKDFMVPQPKEKHRSHFLVRKFTGMHGKHEIRLLLDPRPNYGKRGATFTQEEDGRIRIGKGELFLHIPPGASAEMDKRGCVITVHIHGRETKEIVLEEKEHPNCPPVNGDLEERTIRFWRRWVRKGHFFQAYKNELIRSAITLKLMQFYSTGAIVAAPTTSLPEEIGGIRNWDYRYTWVRDATFTLYGLYVLGFRDEARRFFRFVENIAEDCEKKGKDIEIFYTIHGKEVPEERTLAHLEGYRGSRPVRIGNGARSQFQLDIYGSLVDAYYFMYRRGLRLTKRNRRMIHRLVGWIEKRWEQPDNGIWEVRGGKHHFTYSKVMAWVGVNRALRMRDQLDLTEEKRKRWEELEQSIRDWIWERCYKEEIQSFGQHAATAHQDATNLILVLLQFLDKKNPQTKEIIRNTCKELRYKDIYVYRYKNPDGIEGGEGAFVLCTFWLVSALAATGEVDEAERLFAEFEKTIGHTRLMAEEVDPETGEYLGNHPQAFSHLGYIMSAFYVSKYRHKPLR